MLACSLLRRAPLRASLSATSASAFAPSAALALPRRAAAASASAAPAPAPAAAAARALSSLAHLAHLQGRPPSVDASAGTFAAFYYKNIREHETPTKDHIVAFGQDERFTVGAFDRQVYAYALGLLDGLGLRKGDKVAVWMTDELEHLVVRYAAALVGATAVEIDPRLGMEHVLTILAREECRALFASPRFGGQDRLAELARAFAAELAPAVAEGGALPLASKRLRSLKFLVCASAEFAEGVVRLRDLPVFGNDGSYDQDDVAAVQSFLAAADTLTVPYAPAAAAAAAGGAGFARGSPVSHAQLLASAAAAAKALALTSADVLVSTAPLGGALGLAAGPLAAAAAGAKLVLPAKAFDAAKTLAAASQQKASVLVALPEHVAPLAAELARDEARPATQRAYALASLRAGVVLGGQGASLGRLALKGISSF